MGFHVYVEQWFPTTGSWHTPGVQWKNLSFFNLNLHRFLSVKTKLTNGKKKKKKTALANCRKKNKPNLIPLLSNPCILFYFVVAEVSFYSSWLDQLSGKIRDVVDKVEGVALLGCGRGGRWQKLHHFSFECFCLCHRSFHAETVFEPTAFGQLW